MKKLLALILAGAMLLSFAACGGNETPENETTTEAVVESTEAATDAVENDTTVDATQAPEGQAQQMLFHSSTRSGQSSATMKSPS